MECCTGIVSSSFLNAWFKTKNTKSVTYIFSSVIASMKIWLTHEVDLSWYFWSFSWYNLHIVQQHERFRSLVCSLVTRHLIRRLSTGNEEIGAICWRITRAWREFNRNQFDKFAVKLLNSEETVSHFPCEYSRIVWGIFSLMVEQFLLNWAAIISTVNNFVAEWRFSAEWHSWSPAQERQC